MAIDSTPLGELLLKKRRGVLSPFEDSELRSTLQGAAKKLLLQYPETSKTKLRRSSAEKTLADRVSSGAFPNLKPLILTEEFDVFPRQRISIWLAMDLSEHANTDDLSDDLKRSLGPILEPTSPNWEPCVLETASNCLAAILLAGLPDRSEDEIKWWQPDYLSVPFRQSLGIRHRLFDVLSVIRYYPGDLINIAEGNSIISVANAFLIPAEAIIETCEKINTLLKWQLRSCFSRILSNKLEVERPTAEFWARFGQQVFWTFLQGIRGRDTSFGIGKNKEIHTFEYLKSAANAFFLKNDELQKYIELDLGLRRKMSCEDEFKDFEDVSNRAINEMLGEAYGDCRLEIEPNHQNVRNFAYRRQFCFVVSLSLPPVDGDVLNVDDPEFQNVLRRQDKIPRYSTVLAKDSRNLTTDRSRNRKPVKRKYVIRFYWILLMACRKRVQRSVLRDVLPRWTETPTRLRAQNPVSKSRVEGALSTEVNLNSDALSDCMEDIRIYIETLRVELLEGSTARLGASCETIINEVFALTREYVRDKYYKKVKSWEFDQIVDFYKSKKDQITMDFESQLLAEQKEILSQNNFTDNQVVTNGGDCKSRIAEEFGWMNPQLEDRN
jgi:hypothetical protein